ncbi:MAG: lipoate--protein ligase family protein [Euryarchaeota archaeon]|nr:lipoate--protein ligase family protein [Euryarchaeota archaeon]
MAPRPVSLVLDGFATGRENMERDEWLLARGEPVVRLYGWDPACVSLGRTQTEADIDLDAAERHGIDVVRRKTGGGALLHNEVELTYAVILPLDHPGLSRNILESYRTMSGPILDAFRALGVDAVFGEGKGGRDTLCYLREEGVSIFVDGRKISGGAQRRTQQAVLQHGTMVLRLDAERTAEVLKAPVEAVRRKVVGLDALGFAVTRDEVVNEVVAAYERGLGPLERARAPWQGDEEWRPEITELTV